MPRLTTNLDPDEIAAFATPQALADLYQRLGELAAHHHLRLDGQAAALRPDGAELRIAWLIDGGRVVEPPYRTVGVLAAPPDTDLVPADRGLCYYIRDFSPLASAAGWAGWRIAHLTCQPAYPRQRVPRAIQVQVARLVTYDGQIDAATRARYAAALAEARAALTTAADAAAVARTAEQVAAQAVVDVQGLRGVVSDATYAILEDGAVLIMHQCAQAARAADATRQERAAIVAQWTQMLGGILPV